MAPLGSIHLHITENTKQTIALNLRTFPLAVYEEAQQNCPVSCFTAVR